MACSFLFRLSRFMVITLIGYRGCGKSSVAPLLATSLGWDYVDSDSFIEQAAGCSIRQIFETEGEAGFRVRETEALRSLLCGQNLVVAAGGGAVLSEVNRNMMQDAGPVVWMQASNETLAGRISGDASTVQRRPSLTGQSVTDEVAAVMEVRRPVYQAAATLVVDADNQSPQDISREIIEKLNLTSKQGADV